MGKKKLNYDQDTINYEDILLEDKWGKIYPEIFDTILELKTDGRCAIKGILKILRDDSLDHKELLGELKYRYVIRCSQNSIAKLINMDISHFSKGIKQLVDAKLVVKDTNAIYINPLLFNTNQIVDKRTLQKFGIPYKDVREPQITRKKQDMSKVRKDLQF